MQYHRILLNTIKYHVIACNTIEYHAIPLNTNEYYSIAKYHRIPCNTIEYHLIPSKSSVLSTVLHPSKMAFYNTFIGLCEVKNSLKMAKHFFLLYTRLKRLISAWHVHGHAHEISDAWPTLVETVDNVEVVEVVGVVDVRKVSQVGKSGRSGRFCLVWFGLNQTPHIDWSQAVSGGGAYLR